MSWTSLKNGIATVIKTNGNQEITGNALQGVLNTIVNSLGAHATFVGMAIPSTSPGTPDGPVFYFAFQEGSYSNFGATPFEVSEGEFGIFVWDGTTWSAVKYTTGVDFNKIDSLVIEAENSKKILYGFINHPYSEVLQDYTWWNTGNVNIGSTYTGAYQTLSGGEWRRWERISILKGQKATISTKGGQNARAFCITNAETNIVIAKGDANVSYIDEPYIYIAEVDSYLYANTSKNYEGYINIEDTKTLANKFQDLSHDIEELNHSIEELNPIIQDLSVIIEELTAINDISSYAIDANNGSIVSVSLSGFHVKFYEVEQGDTIRIQITRANANAGKRLSGCFYYTNDDQTYNVVSIEGFEIWRKNGNLSVDYQVTVPAGVNRIGVYGGQTNPNITSFLVQKYVYGSIALLKAKSEQIINATNEVISYPPSNLNNRIITLEESIELGNTPIIFNPLLNLKKSALKILDIGNSFTVDATNYLPSFATAINADVSDMCLYTMLRSSGSWYTFIKSWLGQDGTSGTTSQYSFTKVLGGITPTYDNTDALTRMHSVLKDVDWDLIILHQVSDYSADYDQWEGDTNSGHLTEVIRILRTYQPQASIGMLMAHVSKSQSSGSTQARWQLVAKSVKFMQSRYGVDFVIPVATAIENIRASSANTSLHGLSRDNHHLGYGLARYVAAATYFQMLICGRYGGSVVGNTYTHTVTTAEHNDVNESYQGDLIDVTAENRQVAQIAAALACSDMFTINNPDNVEI